MKPWPVYGNGLNRLNEHCLENWVPRLLICAWSVMEADELSQFSSTARPMNIGTLAESLPREGFLLRLTVSKRYGEC
jgi:hypothetical protein